MFDLRKIFDLRKFFAVPKDFLKSKICCIIIGRKKFSYCQKGHFCQICQCANFVLDFNVSLSYYCCLTLGSNRKSKTVWQCYKEFVLSIVSSPVLFVPPISTLCWYIIWSHNGPTLLLYPTNEPFLLSLSPASFIPSVFSLGLLCL